MQINMLGVGNTVVNKADKVPTCAGGCALVNRDRYCTITIKEAQLLLCRRTGCCGAWNGRTQGEKGIQAVDL